VNGEFEYSAGGKQVEPLLAIGEGFFVETGTTLVSTCGPGYC
jgi:hypothetical protein